MDTGKVGIDSIVSFLQKMGKNVSAADVQKQLKGKKLTDFDSDKNGQVETKEFAKSLAELFECSDTEEKTLEQQVEDLYKELNGVSGNDNDDKTVSEDDFKALGLDSAESADTAVGADSAASADSGQPAGSNSPSGTGDSGTGTVPQVNKSDLENKSVPELQSDRADALAGLREAQQEKQNNEKVKAAEEAVAEKKDAYDQALETVAEQDSEYQEQIQSLKAEKDANDEAVNNQKSAIDNINSNIDSKQSELDSVNSQLGSLKEPSQSEYTKIETDPETGESHEVPDTEAYQAAHDEYEAEKAALEEQKTQLEEELTNLQQELADAETQLTTLEANGTEIDGKLNDVLTEAAQNDVQGAQEALDALNDYTAAQTTLQETKTTETQALDAAIAQYRENLDTIDGTINEKRAEELKSAKEGDENNPWETTDFSKYPPETVAKIAEAYNKDLKEGEPDFLTKAAEMLKSDNETQAKQYESIVGSLVSEAAKDESVADMLQSSLHTAITSNPADTRLLDSIFNAADTNKVALSNIIDKYNQANSRLDGINAFETDLSSIPNLDVSKYTAKIDEANRMQQTIKGLEQKENESESDKNARREAFDAAFNLAHHDATASELAQIAAEYDSVHGEGAFLAAAKEVYAADDEQFAELENTLKESKYEYALEQLQVQNDSKEIWDEYILNGDSAMINAAMNPTNELIFIGDNLNHFLDRAAEIYGKDSEEYNKIKNMGIAEQLKTDEGTAQEKENWDELVLNAQPEDLAQIAQQYGEAEFRTKIEELYGPTQAETLLNRLEEGKNPKPEEEVKPEDKPHHAVSVSDLPEGTKIQDGKIIDKDGKEIGYVSEEYTDASGDQFADKVKYYNLYDADEETLPTVGAANTDEASETSTEEVNTESNLTDEGAKIYAGELEEAFNRGDVDYINEFFDSMSDADIVKVFASSPDTDWASLITSPNHKASELSTEKKQELMQHVVTACINQAKAGNKEALDVLTNQAYDSVSNGQLNTLFFDTLFENADNETIKALSENYASSLPENSDSTGSLIGDIDRYKNTGKYDSDKINEYHNKIRDAVAWKSSPEQVDDEPTEVVGAGRSSETDSAQEPADTTSDPDSSTTVKQEDLQAGWHTDGTNITDEHGLPVTTSSKSEIEEKGYKVNDNGNIVDADGNVVGRYIAPAVADSTAETSTDAATDTTTETTTAADGQYFLYDTSKIPEGYSISADGYLQHEVDGKMQEVHAVNGADGKYTLEAREGESGVWNIVDADGNVIGEAIEQQVDANGDGVLDTSMSFYINRVEDEDIPQEWFAGADGTFFDEVGAELTKVEGASVFGTENTDYKVDGDRIFDAAGNLIGRVETAKDGTKEYYMYVNPDLSKTVDAATESTESTESTDDSSTPEVNSGNGVDGVGGGGGSGGGGVGGVDGAQEPTQATTPADETGIPHQELWTKPLQEGTPAYDALQEILALLKSGKDPKVIMEKLKEILNNPDLSLDDKIRIMNAIHEQYPDALKTLAEDEGLNDEFANIFSQMVDSGDYTVEDMLKLDELYSNITGQTDSDGFKLSNKAEDGKKSPEENFVRAMAKLFEKATPEELEKLNNSKHFNFESYLPQLMDYKDEKGNSLLSGVLKQVDGDTKVTDYKKQNPDKEDEWKSKYINEDSSVNFDKFFDDMYGGSEKWDSELELKAAFSFISSQGDIEKFLSEQIKNNKDFDSAKALNAILRLLSNEYPMLTKM
ncbi:hypothetical protein IJ182_08990 [bacterium]|nr:hypothetical protein [bacterium]